MISFFGRYFMDVDQTTSEAAVTAWIQGIIETTKPDKDMKR